MTEALSSRLLPRDSIRIAGQSVLHLQWKERYCDKLSSRSFHFPQTESFYQVLLFIHRKVTIAARSKAFVCSRSLAGTVGSNPVRGAWMSVICECCVLSDRGLCDGLITRPEEIYRLCCLVVWDLETLWMRRPRPTLRRSATWKIQTLHVSFESSIVNLFNTNLAFVTYICSSLFPLTARCFNKTWDV
jgi:hypothetical protein